MTAKKVIVITGYEPFGGDTYNPSMELAKNLDGKEYKDYIFRYATIPVNRKQCLKAVEKALSDFSPSIMICTGLAGGHSAIAVERAALNVTDFPIPDNEGYVSLNEAIDPEGPAAYFSTLPIRAIVKKIREAGVPAYVSNSAGTFCCNMVMYGLLNYIAKHSLPIRAGFIHVPFTPEMAADKMELFPTMDLTTMTKALETAAMTTVDYETDISLLCGAVS